MCQALLTISVIMINPTLLVWSVFVFVNTLRPRQNGRRFADDTFKRIFLNENIRNSIKISLKFVRKGPINNNPALVQIMAWRRPGDKPLSAPMLVSFPTHICVTRPQWVKTQFCKKKYIYVQFSMFGWSWAYACMLFAFSTLAPG